MKPEERVVSPQLAKKMKELGFKQNAYWTWYESSDSTGLVHNPDWYRGLEEKSFDAYTVAELGEMLPGSIKRDGKTYQLYFLPCADGYICEYNNVNGCEVGLKAFALKTEADARAKMLIYLAEKEIINPKKT